MELRCVHCGSAISRLLVQYSPGNIRLMKCDECKLVADPYVECEFMIVLIDLILHKEKAYRHLLCNMLNQDLVAGKGLLRKSIFVYLILDGYRSLFLTKLKEDWWGPSYALFPIGICTRVVVAVLLGNALFYSTLVFLTKFLLGSLSETVRYKGFFQAIVFSSYFKIYLVAMMVWEFPQYVVCFIDIFVLSSNIVAFKVLTQLPTTSCLLCCLAAHAMKFVTYIALANI